MWRGNLAMMLSIAVLLAALGVFGVAGESIDAGAGSGAESTAALCSHPSAVIAAYRRGERGHYDQIAGNCTPCPSCSGALTPTADNEPLIKKFFQAPAIKLHYSGVVPSGIRRPPRYA